MIVVVMSEYEIGSRTAKDFANEHLPDVIGFPERYPERIYMRNGYAPYVGAVVERHNRVGDQIIVTDSDLILYLFRVMIKEGRLRAEQLTLVVNELNTTSKRFERKAYIFDSDGRFTGKSPELLGMFRSLSRRLL